MTPSQPPIEPCLAEPSAIGVGHKSSIIPLLFDSDSGGHVVVHIPECYDSVGISSWSENATYNGRHTGTSTVIVSSSDVDVQGLKWNPPADTHWDIWAVAFRGFTPEQILSESVYGCEGVPRASVLLIDSGGQFSTYQGTCAP